VNTAAGAGTSTGAEIGAGAGFTNGALAAIGSATGSIGAGTAAGCSLAKGFLYSRCGIMTSIDVGL
jgi:hypothetical protein